MNLTIEALKIVLLNAVKDKQILNIAFVCKELFEFVSKYFAKNIYKKVQCEFNLVENLNSQLNIHIEYPKVFYIKNIKTEKCYISNGFSCIKFINCDIKELEINNELQKFTNILSMPAGVRKLILKGQNIRFKPGLENYNNLKELILDEEFHWDKKINLPNGLKKLVFPNKGIARYILNFPTQLEILDTNELFQLSLLKENFNLKSLTISGALGIDGDFPPNLEELTLNYWYFDSCQKAVLPSSLKILKLFWIYENCFTLPDDLIKFKTYMVNLRRELPTRIKKLTITGNDSDKTEFSIIWPQNLEYLHFEDGLHFMLKDLPQSLKVLKIREEYNYPIDNFPSGLEKILLPESYKFEIPEKFKNIVFKC